MEDDESFEIILNGFGLSDRARNRFIEDFRNATDLMNSAESQLKEVISNQNKVYRHHGVAAQRCYLNAMQAIWILTFRKWAIYAVKEGNTSYDAAEVDSFDLDWINCVMDDYNQAVVSTTKPSDVNLKITKFDGQNWHDVKSAFVMALASIYG